MGNQGHCAACGCDKDENQTLHGDHTDCKLAPAPMSAPQIGRGSRGSDPDAVCKAQQSYEHYRQSREQHRQGLGQQADAGLETRVEELADGSRYEGQFRGKCRQGWGKFSWATGGSYEGQFESNNMHGDGTYTWSDGSTYTGLWQSNNLGPDGVMKWTDGRVYEGHFVNGKKHGEGRLSWPDGRWYSGQWEGGKQHGVGLTCTGRGPPAKSQWDHGKLVKWLEGDG
uniref:MORN repeat-containing protein 5 n=1 Tax=Alexandrium monilatum TaxID=311494 RepID=A0A7S4Q8X9_9DINO|mmetsp:Transcript_3941/g.11840  ORF Transcript_3941/g.11840 Transcript_3941/m.11840 type:complete len:226 (+) Transcript_3941:112-789(+)